MSYLYKSHRKQTVFIAPVCIIMNVIECAIAVYAVYSYFLLFCPSFEQAP
jgi:hypothetical protein